MSHEVAAWAAPAPGVDEALQTRKSIRAFLPQAIPKATVEAILCAASRSPSGTNTQPWIVHALAGAELKRLISAIVGVLPAMDPRKPDSEHEPDYPTAWPSPYIERRRKVGWDLYTLLGIKRGEHDRITAQRNKNFEFFGAPVGLIFSIDSRLGRGSWLDYGMYVQGVMLAARARGLATCPQAAFTHFSSLIAQHLQFAEHQRVVCGMAMGYADPQALVNTLETDREPVSAFATFGGFDEETGGAGDGAAAGAITHEGPPAGSARARPRA